MEYVFTAFLIILSSSIMISNGKSTDEISLRKSTELNDESSCIELQTLNGLIDECETFENKNDTLQSSLETFVIKHGVLSVNWDSDWQPSKLSVSVFQWML